jgi:parvulin-like peptidyl-prolyl isomerase
MRDGKPDQPTGTFPAEEKIAAQLKDGEISTPVDVGDAFLIVRRDGYRKELNPTFEEAAEKAAALAYSARVKEKKEEFFAKQKDDAFIEILIKEPPERYLKAARAMAQNAAARERK